MATKTTSPNGKAERAARSQTQTKFPSKTLAEAQDALMRPLSPAAVKFLIVGTNRGGATVAIYVDVRTVIARLNQVCGESWSDVYLPIAGSAVLGDEAKVGLECQLTLYGVTRRDVGFGSDSKAVYSDALKRAAVHFGVGHCLYAHGVSFLYWGGGRERIVEPEGNRKARLSRENEAYLRERYASWLERSSFGEALDHGDAPGALGLEGSEVETAAAPAAEERADSPAPEGVDPQTGELAAAETGRSEGAPELGPDPFEAVSGGQALERIERACEQGKLSPETLQRVCTLVDGTPRPTQLSLSGSALVIEVVEGIVELGHDEPAVKSRLTKAENVKEGREKLIAGIRHALTGAGRRAS